jgi:hypothetical protein
MILSSHLEHSDASEWFGNLWCAPVLSRARGQTQLSARALTRGLIKLIHYPKPPCFRMPQRYRVKP